MYSSLSWFWLFSGFRVGCYKSRVYTRQTEKAS